MASKKQLQSRATAFWGKERRVERLRQSVRDILSHTNTSEDEFLTQIMPQAGYAPFNAARLDRFFESEQDDGGLKPRAKNSVLLMCAAHCAGGLNQSQSLSDFAALLEEHQKAFPAEDLQTLFADEMSAAANGEEAQVTEGEFTSFVDVFARLLSIKSGSFLDVARVFFPDWSGELRDQPLQRRYACYRFDHVPEMVVKSFLVLSSPFNGEPFCSFTNYFVVEGAKNPRKTSGIVFPMRDGIYFIGRIQNGEGLKVMLIPPVPAGHEPDYFSGLVLSFDDGSIPVASRILIAPTSALHHDNADCGRKSLASLTKEIEAITEVSVLRNRIEFTLENEIECGGRRLSQDEMREETGRRIERVGPPFTLNGEPFNPADSRFYTFNSALRLARRS